MTKYIITRERAVIESTGISAATEAEAITLSKSLDRVEWSRVNDTKRSNYRAIRAHSA